MSFSTVASRLAHALPKPQRSGRVVILDGLRLVAASMVVFYHYVGIGIAWLGHRGTTGVSLWGKPPGSVFPHTLHYYAQFGWTGVELFFLISGFVISMSGWGRRPAEFFISRVVRLVPAYWAAIGLIAIVLTVFPLVSRGVGVRVTLMNLTMVQGLFHIRNLAPSFWTLLVEMKFYLLFGLVAIGGVTYKRMVAFCVLWSVGSLAAWGSHEPLLNFAAIPQFSPYFIAGIAFFLIYRFGSNLILWGIVVFSWLVTLRGPYNPPQDQATEIITVFFVVMALIATHWFDWVQWRWLTVAGALTYPLYLIHQDVGYVFVLYLRDYIPPHVLVVLTYAAMLAIAWLIYRLVERPVAPRLKKALTKAVGTMRQHSPAAVAASAPSAAPALSAAPVPVPVPAAVPVTVPQPSAVATEQAPEANLREAGPAPHGMVPAWSSASGGKHRGSPAI